MRGLDRWRIGEPDDGAYRAGAGPGREIPRPGLAPGARFRAFLSQGVCNEYA